MRMKIFLALAATALIAYSGNASADCASLPGFKLTIKQYHIDLNDRRPVCVEVPGAFVIQIVNPMDGGHTVQDNDVTVQQKVDPDEARVTIAGNSVLVNNKLMLVVTVEEGPQGPPPAEGEEFEFWIKIKGVGMLDPRIRVIPGGGGGSE